ncbi:MAG: nucleoside triphosphate pyrophosphatase [Agitococcus sp.]
MPLPLVLASTSAFRSELLNKLQLKFIQDNPNCDETPFNNETAPQLAVRLAIAKAQALAHQYPHHLIIGSDQVATFAGQLIGKPLTHDKAVQQLSSFSGQAIDFYTGLCLFNSFTGHIQSIVECFRVYFRVLDAAQIERYLQAEQPYFCAGSFKSEGLGICLFKKLEGNDPNSLIGLPLIQLVTMLHNEGVNVP